MTGRTFLDSLNTAAADADAAEANFRKQFDDRIRALEQERAFAYRRLNLMRAVANAIASAKHEEQAVAIARATLRSSGGGKALFARPRSAATIVRTRAHRWDRKAPGWAVAVRLPGHQYGR